MSAIPPTATPPTMTAALDRLWIKFLPEIERRLATLRLAAASLRNGALTTEEREAAHQDAHKLSGVLGTFGLQAGTELARQAELLLSEELPASAADPLSAWVDDLEVLIRQRNKS